MSGTLTHSDHYANVEHLACDAGVGAPGNVVVRSRDVARSLDAQVNERLVQGLRIVKCWRCYGRKLGPCRSPAELIPTQARGLQEEAPGIYDVLSQFL